MCVRARTCVCTCVCVCMCMVFGCLIEHMCLQVGVYAYFTVVATYMIDLALSWLFLMRQMQ